MSTPEIINKALTAALQDQKARKLESALRHYIEAETAAKALLDANAVVGIDLALNTFFTRAPMAIGDVLVELGRSYDTAIERYLRIKENPQPGDPIKAEDLWLRLARASLAKGDAAFRGGDGTAARAAYALVLSKTGATYAVPNTALYDGNLQIMRAKVSAWLSAPDDINTADVRDFPPNQMITMTGIQGRMEQIDAGLNFLGYPPDYPPIFSFGRLQEIARAFAQFAAQANRDYINFARSAQNETQTLRQLEQAVSLSQAAVAIERSRADTVAREIAAAEQAVAVANVRRENAETAAERFRTTGWELARLRWAQSWAGATQVPRRDQINLTINGMEDLGISAQSSRRADLMATLEWAQARRSYGMERDRHAAAARELRAGVTLAQAQLQTTRARQETARLTVRAAQWRHRNSQENLNAARSQPVSADLLQELSGLARETAEIYLQRAIEAAFLMQQAYNLENSVKVDRIRLDYGDLSVADGRYAADLLLRDIDEFTLQAVTGVQNKLQSGIHIISLAQDFPYALADLIRDGEAQFDTRLDDFHRSLPGTYDARIKRVRVLIVATAGSQGISGTLTCAGVSTVRQQDGQIKSKVHSSEAMVLPRTPAIADTNAPLPDGAGAPGQLEVFENVGLGVSWRLSLPAAFNDIDLPSTTDVKVVIAYWFRHDTALEQADYDALDDFGEAEYTLNIRPRTPEWSALMQAGTVSIDLAPRLPGNHRRDTQIQGAIAVILRPDATVQRVDLGLRADRTGQSVTAQTNGDGVVILETAASPGALAGVPMVQSFTLTLDPARNPPLADAGANALDLSGLFVISLQFEYTYRQKG